MLEPPRRTAPQTQRRRPERASLRRRLLKARPRRDDDVALLARLDPAEQGEPFRRDLLVGQNVFHREKLGFGEEERVGQPVRQALVQLVPGCGRSGR